MSYKILSADEIRQLDALVELRRHIQETHPKNLLVGAQWVVVEVIAFREESRTVAKVIGESNDGFAISGPIVSWRERKYCGIVYHHEDWTRRSHVVEFLKGMARDKDFQYAFYNPYQDLVRVVEVL